MPKSTTRSRFSLGNPRFLALEAFAQTGGMERHLSWFASFDENIDEDEGHRVVIATLHAAEDEASVTITIAGSFYWASGAAEPKTREKLAKAIRESFALETMYDLARVQAHALLAAAQLSMDIPMVPPAAEVREFSERSEDSEDANEQPSSDVGEADSA